MDYRRGFDTLEHETAVDRLPVQGELPDWLAGTLIRNGPAVFDHHGKSFRHWFDGQAMLHRFGFADGQVSYANHILDTPQSRALLDEGRIRYVEFATDPCASLFGRFFTRFTRKQSQNTPVNVTHFDGRDAALSEVAVAVQFDPETLKTVGVVDYADDLTGTISTAHPHAEPGTGALVNYLLRYGRHSAFQVYRQPVDSRHRELIGSVAADLPGYLHSFAVTEWHVVLMIYPFVVNPLSFLLRGRPFIENYRWRPELGTRIVTVRLADGEQREYQAPPCFAFHHINAFEEDGDLVLDLCAFPDADVVKALYLSHLRTGEGAPVPFPTRYRIREGYVEVTRLSEQPLELPRINYGGYHARPYRFAYGTGATDPEGRNFLDQLVKLDVTTGQVRIWGEAEKYPGEPVFVAAPTAAAEDDGVVLSVVLDAARDRSMLLVLDAMSFTELARAEVPHAIPFGFHGRFAP